MKICFLLLSFAMLFSVFAFAQFKSVDSTLTAINFEKNDSIRIENLGKFIDTYFSIGTSDNTKSAMPFVRKMHSDAEKTSNKYLIARANQALAILHYLSFKNDSALHEGLLAQKEWELEKNDVRLAYVKHLRELLYYDNSDFVNAIQAGNESLELCRKEKLYDLFVIVANYTGTIYSQQGEFEKSLVLFNEVLLTPGLSSDRAVYALVNMGITLKKLKRFAESGAAYDTAMIIVEKNNFTDFKQFILMGKANLAFAENKIDLGISIANEALVDVLNDNNYNGLLDIYELLRKSYEKKQDFKQALLYADKLSSVKDTIASRNTLREYRDLEKKYESAVKDSKIAEQENKIASANKKRLFLIFAIASLVLIFSLATVLFFVNRKRKEILLKKDIAASEMKALRAQMNPHFLFNSLTAIQQMVMNNENESAFKYIDTYSKLTRQILENSEKKWITVKAETTFLEMYLQIESLRFDNAFSYSITLENDIMPNSDKIPAMILQPVIENAIKHGLLSKVGDKKLSITFNKKHDDAPLEVTVQDNGIGRKASANNTNNSEHQSMSLDITEHRLKLLDEKGGSKMTVTDLYDENDNAAGTLVTILITQPD